MQNRQLASFCLLKKYCETENYKGWDPYDGLNSKLFQFIPLFKKTSLCRLLVIQVFKRSPVNFRPFAMVSKEYNTKGLGLFLQGYCNLYRVVCGNSELEREFGTKEILLGRINTLAELLLTMQSKGYSGACWGYSFDWQSKAFFLPAYTPTVVATSFVVEALLSAYEITKNENYLSVSLSSSRFILNDLNIISKEKGFMFSYSPLDNRAVYNATLLATKTLSLIYNYTKNGEYKQAAFSSALAVCDQQNIDGSFPHSDQVGNLWRDNFHTGFKLESLMYYQKYCNDNYFLDNLERGYQYWIQNYFDRQTGIAYYYDAHTDLIDLHCAAQALATLFKLEKLEQENELAEKIQEWAINHMQNIKEGYFYFQKKGNMINKIPYMRWPNAWMFYGMSYWILVNCRK